MDTQDKQNQTTNGDDSQAPVDPGMPPVKPPADMPTEPGGSTPQAPSTDGEEPGEAEESDSETPTPSA